MKFLVFKTMYAAACQSTLRRLRCSMMYLLDKISRPHRRPLDDDWTYFEVEYRRSLHFTIRADFSDNLDVLVRRCRWAEELKIAYMFIFWSARPGTMVTVGDQQVTQNKWVYEAVTRVLSPKRIAISGRGADVCEWLPELPNLPRVYHHYDCSVNPPIVHKRKACHYQDYEDTSPELTVEELDLLE